MSIYDIIILALIGVDALSLTLVISLKVWARKLLEQFGSKLVAVLSGEDKDGDTILDKLGHNIYSKLYRYFNLQKGYDVPENSQSMPNEVPEIFANMGDKVGNLPLTAIAKQMGISDTGFLSALPNLMKLYNATKGSNSTDSVSKQSGDDAW